MTRLATALLALIMVAWTSIALPQGNSVELRTRLDNYEASLKGVQARLFGKSPDHKEPNGGDLQALRAQIDPLDNDLQGLAARIAQRLEPLRQKLDSFGPAPADKAKAAAEPPATTEGRKLALQAFDETQTLFRRAKVLEDEAARTQRIVAAKRRQLFVRALFERVPSVLDAGVWAQVAAELPGDVSAMRYLVIDSYEVADQRLARGEAVVLLILALLVVLGFFPARRFARRFLTRDPRVEAVPRLTRTLAAVRIAVATAAVPILTIGILVGAGEVFGLYDPRIRPVVLAVFAGVAQVAVAVGVARGMLAPNRPAWRIVPVADDVAKRLRGAAVTATVINAVFRLLEAFNDGVAASLPVSVATRAIGTLLIAMVVSVALVRIARARAASRQKAAGRDETEVDRNWFGLLNVLGWVAVAMVVGAALVGYVAFAAFLVGQAGSLIMIATGLTLLLVIASDGIPRALAPNARAGRFLLHNIGMRQEARGQLAVLASGILKATSVVVAVVLVLVPWGLQSEDLLGALHRAFFGFRVGGLLVSPVSLGVAILLFAVAMLASRSVRRWLETKYLPQTRLGSGLQNSIVTSLGYIGFVAAATVALSYLGLSFEKFALVAGALSVGIGFGLQSIVNNFVSGLILLWERAIQVGDWIAIGGEQGYVRRITVRSTEIETFERATLILPNSSLVSGTVKNWFRGTRTGRVILSVGVDYASDPEQVHDILLRCATGHERVLTTPAPFVFFTGFGDSAMTFELYAYINDVEKTGRAKSDIFFAICRAFREAEIDISSPQREVRLRPRGPRGKEASATS